MDKNRDYAQVLEETDQSGTQIASYIYGLDLISQNRTGVLSYYHYDGQMSTRRLTDAAQNITDGYTFDAFGILLDRFGATQNDYLYTGEQFDPNVGFYYLRARYYNPEIGRFINADPWKGSIYEPGSLHRYLYCNNEPIEFTDYSGKFPTLIELTTVVAVAVIIAASSWFFKEMDRPANYHNPLKDLGYGILSGAATSLIMFLFIYPIGFGLVMIMMSALAVAMIVGVLLNAYYYDYLNQVVSIYN